MTNHQMALIDRQLRVHEQYRVQSRDVPENMTLAAIAKRNEVAIEEVEARLRVLKTP